MLNAVLITEEKIPVCWAGPRDGLPTGPRPNVGAGPRIGPDYMAGPTWGWAVAQQKEQLFSIGEDLAKQMMK